MCFLTFPKTKNTAKFSFVKCFLPKNKKAEKESPPEAPARLSKIGGQACQSLAGRDLPMEEKFFHFSRPPYLQIVYWLLPT
ncbi:MAG: hypothetical protein AMJ73_03760 [candidate division Zixibacteria bacterium SM1_73]|nr:MAG: hypothetical protein AMJ73_03760 [candidate division Zixibacteria bacterium SM1_73]